jgi:hypothetical protein
MDRSRRLQLLVTVKAAPNPSTNYGETVCVAGISTDLADPGWIRLYHELCGPSNDVAFYVGNQAKRENVFSVLGVYYPKFIG